jgi:hypothetical protein
MKIKNKTRYVCKHIGLVLLIVGLVLMVGQAFPASSITLIISLVFQLIGFNEPFWFLNR